MKAKIYELLTQKQQDEIYDIAFDIHKRIKKREITYAQGFSEMKYGKRIKDWINSIDNFDEVYNTFLPELHKRLLKAYKAIIEPLINKGVLITSNAGTQLGLVRDGKIIDWDDDIDLLMDVKDFNKYKHRITWNAFKNGWLLKTRDWLKDDLKPKKGNNYIWVQLYTIRGIKLDFGRFKTTFYPFIDIFPGIRTDRKLTQKENEEITLNLVEYYDACNRNLTKNLLKNQRFIKDANSYHEGLKLLDQSGTCSKAKKSLLTETLRKYYKEDGKMLFQLNVAAPLFETFDYSNRNTKNIELEGVKHKFIYADNYEDHFDKEYGKDSWQNPRRTHQHFLLPWFFEFKK